MAINIQDFPAQPDIGLQPENHAPIPPEGWQEVSMQIRCAVIPLFSILAGICIAALWSVPIGLLIGAAGIIIYCALGGSKYDYSLTTQLTLSKPPRQELP